MPVTVNRLQAFKPTSAYVLASPGMCLAMFAVGRDHYAFQMSRSELKALAQIIEQEIAATAPPSPKAKNRRRKPTQ